MKPEKDYTRYTFRITLIVIGLLVGISFVPPFTIGGIHFKRANILSEVITFGDQEQAGEGGLTDLDREFVREAERKEEEQLQEERGESVIAPGSESMTVDMVIPSLGQEQHGHSGQGLPAIDGEGEPVTAFEDFTTPDRMSVADFTALLGTATQNRVVRIAFLGDSFIEGDIITADVREQLQDAYGGQGVGFVPFGTPLAIGRSTVVHNFNGWTNYNLINKKSTPQDYRERYAVTGILSVPSAGAWSQYRGTNFRNNLASWSRSRLIFANTGHSTIRVAVNDTIKQSFTPESSEALQQINISGAGMSKLRVTVDNPSGFVGYGAVLEGARGVSVDNYSIRSNSGLALFGTSAAVNRQLREILNYDMIVLQYGLNAMDPNNTNYSSYGEQLRRVIEYIKGCFPRAAIVLMGVGDRGTQREGRFVTMRAVPAMLAEQRAAAEECGIAFWSIFDAMGGENSMAQFVKWNWAAKDYTHLGYRGGKHIAQEFVKALSAARTGAGSNPGEDTGPEYVPTWSFGAQTDRPVITAPDNDHVQAGEPERHVRGYDPASTADSTELSSEEEGHATPTEALPDMDEAEEGDDTSEHVTDDIPSADSTAPRLDGPANTPDDNPQNPFEDD